MDSDWMPSCCLVCRACNCALSAARSASTRSPTPLVKASVRVLTKFDCVWIWFEVVRKGRPADRGTPGGGDRRGRDVARRGGDVDIALAVERGIEPVLRQRGVERRNRAAEAGADRDRDVGRGGQAFGRRAGQELERRRDASHGEREGVMI